MKEKLKEFWKNLQLFMLILACFDFKRNIVKITGCKFKKFFKCDFFDFQRFLNVMGSYVFLQNAEIIIEGLDIYSITIQSYGSYYTPCRKKPIWFKDCTITYANISSNCCEMTFEDCKISNMWCKKDVFLWISGCYIDLLRTNSDLNIKDSTIDCLRYSNANWQLSNDVKIGRAEYIGYLYSVSCCLNASDLTVYKKVRTNGDFDAIVTLKVKKGTPASGFIDGKCRCAEAEVIDIESVNPLYSKSNSKKCENKLVGYSMYDPSFKYEIGKIVKPTSKFIPNNLQHCDAGVHFFLTKKQALDY